MLDLIKIRAFKGTGIAALLYLLVLAACKDDNANEPANQLPVAGFSISNTDPETGESITFTDASTDQDGEITRWIWNFGDGETSTDQNPQHTFQTAGNYTVSLTVTDDDGGEDTLEEGLVVVDPTVENQPPTASFSVSESLVQKGVEVSFTNGSTDSDGVIETYTWDFGDGNTSSQEDPTHFYSTTGSFTISLTVTDNQEGSTTITEDISVWGEKWSFATADEVKQTTPAIADDGTIYIGSNDDKLYAISPDGTEKWSFLTAGNISTSPSVGPDGTVYIGSDDDNLYALNPADGTEKWAFNTGGNPNNTSAAIEADGSVIYVGSSSDVLYAINTSDGTEKWSYTADGDIQSIALGSSNTLYANHNGSRNLVSINTMDGSENWTFNHGMFAGGSMAVDEANAVYFQGDGDADFIYAINADGTEKWSFELTNSASRGGVVIANGVLYASTKEDTDHLRAINVNNGSSLWSFTTGDGLSATPTVDADGNIYFGSFDDKFYVLDPSGNLKFEFTTGGNIWSSATIGSDGTVYFGSYDFNLYAMEFFSTGPSISTWPTLGKDAKNTNN